jgi:hypothetical protein
LTAAIVIGCAAPWAVWLWLETGAFVVPPSAWAKRAFFAVWIATPVGRLLLVFAATFVGAYYVNYATGLSQDSAPGGYLFFRLTFAAPPTHPGQALELRR